MDIKELTGQQFIDVIETAIKVGLVNGLDFAAGYDDRDDVHRIGFTVPLENGFKAEVAIDADQEYHGENQDSDGGYSQVYVLKVKQLRHITYKHPRHYANKVLNTNEIAGSEALNKYLKGVFHGMRCYHNYSSDRDYEGEEYCLPKKTTAKK